jgi:soluble lytic murein transglycosylase
MRKILWLLVAVVVGLTPAIADVRLYRRSDGVLVMKDEPKDVRQRRLAIRLVEPPTSRLAELVEHWAVQRDLDPRLVQSVMQVESGYNPRALSTKGAIGLMQLMPETALELEVEDPWDPEQNVKGGTEYLRRMLDQFSGDLERALAAYNAGPNAVVRHSGVPPFAETRAYVSRVLCLFEGGCGDEPTGPRIRVHRDAENRIVLTSDGPDG